MATETEPRIPRKTKTYTKVILMPRHGVKNVITKQCQITLPRLRFLDGPEEALS